MDLKTLIRDYLEEAKLMQLSTSVDGQDMNIYWFSATNRRHSEEIMQNAKVSGAMALPHTPEDEPRGLQFEGDAELLVDAGDIQKARSVYEGRIFSAEQIDALITHKERPHRFYRIRPRSLVLFDVVNFPVDSKQELTL
jgi:uncharacterized protein YhbP (UPF0306 family)